MEGQNLLSMVIGRAYNAELRGELTQSGYRRIGSLQWISKSTGEKYELVVSDDESKTVQGLDHLEGNKRFHIRDEHAAPEPKAEEPVVTVNLNVHHKTANAILKQLELSDFYFDLMDRWNDEMYRGTALGQQLRELCKQPQIDWFNFLFLPDPTASGEYLFATLRKGVAAGMHAWLQLPDERYFVPTDGTTDGAWDSLQVGLEFHEWEAQTFETPAAAGQCALKMLNYSDTTYAQTIHRLLGKEGVKLSRNDFYRDADNLMCRIEVTRDEAGRLLFRDVPVQPTIAECIDSLLAPYIKARALQQD